MKNKLLFLAIGILLAFVAIAAVQPLQSTPYDSAGYAASGVISSSDAQLLAIHGYNSKTSAQFILLFNSATVPVDTTVPSITPIRVPASSNFYLDLTGRSVRFSSGISWSNSSTGPTKTIGSADCWVSAEYR